MSVKELESGWFLVRVPDTGHWAQIPPDFKGETIPDEYIFQPEWSRDSVNDYWQTVRWCKR